MPQTTHIQQELTSDLFKEDDQNQRNPCTLSPPSLLSLGGTTIWRRVSFQDTVSCPSTSVSPPSIGKARPRSCSQALSRLGRHLSGGVRHLLGSTWLAVCPLAAMVGTRQPGQTQ